MDKVQVEDIDNFEPVARIVVIGVGGAGNNAVNRMIDENIQNVEFYVANTDKQALSTSKAPNRIVLGEEVTRGLGAGGDPAVGKQAAVASTDTIKSIVKGADMVFIAAGMGKGTGTGAAPVIAQIAKESGALTVAIVTRPFTFEGPKRVANSVEGLSELKDAVDSIIIVSNDKLLMSSGNAPINTAFQESDKILAQSVKTVADLILVPAMINLDFADVRSTLKGSGIALIGYGSGSGPNKAEDAADEAINSPLLEASISGARRAICAVTCGQNVTLYEAQSCVNRINEQAGGAIDIKFGVSMNPNLTDSLLVSVIASDFTDEYDFTTVPQFKMPKDPKELGSGVQEAQKKEIKDLEKNDVGASNEQVDLASEILPDFLKGSDGGNQNS
ncbi:MAG: cell division protein FtsZ [Bacilli bacterium]|jgi:cell division protein FtsZ|nr:cell division protein FtsZ [Bacilli bacterium]MCH4210583.1 cell division protein FtsZ [Bacilli bacterium]MCH4228541.1 cell division protein FtsZ [Bacilli bacterium]MCH4277323.1 cell division protein FtsZ [Bacilli bacterium]MCI2055235.1 cell division protein FtsZ [Bacilli bacterium]